MASKNSDKKSGDHHHQKDGSSSNSSPLFGRMSKRLAQLTKLGGGGTTNNSNSSGNHNATSAATIRGDSNGVVELRKQIDDLETRLSEAEIHKTNLLAELDSARALAATNQQEAEQHAQRIRHLVTDLDAAKSTSDVGLREMESEYRRQIDQLSAQCALALAELAKFKGDGGGGGAGGGGVGEANEDDVMMGGANVDVFCDCEGGNDCDEDDVPFADDTDDDEYTETTLMSGGEDCKVVRPSVTMVDCGSSKAVAKVDVEKSEPDLSRRECWNAMLICDPARGDINLDDDAVEGAPMLKDDVTVTILNSGNMICPLISNHEQKLVDDWLQEKQAHQRENDHLREEMLALQVIINTTDAALNGLTVQLAELREECDRQNQRVIEAHWDIEALRKQNVCQETEISQIKEFQTSLLSKNADNEAVISKLTEEICDLKENIQNLEKRIVILEDEKKLLEEQKESELEELKKMYREEEDNWKTAQAKLEKEFDFLRNCNAEREQQMLDDFEWKLREIEKDSKNKTDKLRDLHKRIRDENDKLLIETSEHATELQRNAEETAERMTMTEAELRQLRGFTQELQKGVKVASDQLESTRAVESRLREEVREARHQLAETRATVGRLQTELNEARTAGERRLRAKELTLNFSFEEQLKKVNDQWDGKLREETRKLKSSLEEEFFTMKMNALHELSTQKDQQMATMIKDYQNKMADVTEKLTRTSKKLEDTERNLSDEIDLAKMAGNLKLNEMQRLMTERENGFHRKETELRTKDKQIEDLQTQLAAHRATLDLVREEKEKLKEQEIRHMKDAQDQQLDLINKDWEEKLKNALDVQSHSHKTQIQTARIELEKAMEMTAQKETEQRECIMDLKDAVIHRDEAIRALNEEVQRLQSGLCKMSKELEFHGKEILRVRNEASRQLRISITPDNATCGSNKEPQARTEDMIAIRQLREALLDKDRLVKKLQEEKKSLHAELRNQTINNKRQLSSSQPVVNVSEPVQSVTKRNKQRTKDLSKRLSAPVLSQYDASATIQLNQSSLPEEDRHIRHHGSDRSSRSSHHKNK